MSDHDDRTSDARPCPGCDVTRRGFLTTGAGTVTVLLTGLARAAGAAQEVTYPIPAADGATIDKEQQVILVRQQGNVYAFNLSCPHQNAAVRWVPDGPRFQCSRHDSRYQPDGTHTSGRATRNMDRLPIRRVGATLVVDTSRLIRSDQDPTGWAGASVHVD